MSQLESIRATLKVLIVRALRLEDVRPEQIGDEQPLLEGEFKIDSIDVLQLVLEIEMAYDVRLVTGKLNRSIWMTVSTLAEAIDGMIQQRSAQAL